MRNRHTIEPYWQIGVLMDGSILRYRAFILTAELGSFTRAADALAYSQPQVSRMVAELESEWGVQLLDRSRAGVMLTSEGTQLLPAARTIVSAQDEFRVQVDEVRGLASGIIRIGTFSSIATHWLPNIIRAFQRDYPGMDYELFLGDYTEIEQALMKGRIDCGFLPLPANPTFKVREVERDELFAVLPEGHALAELDCVTPAQLAKESFLLLEKDRNTGVSEVFERAQVELKPHVTLWDDYAIMSMVESGLGVSVLHGLILKRIPYRVVTRPLSPRSFRTIGFVVKKGSAIPLSVQRFVHYLAYRDEGTRNVKGNR